MTTDRRGFSLKTTSNLASGSTAGYADQADALIERYEAIDSALLFDAITPLLPAPPARLLDVGAGTGRDGAYFSSLGYDVSAVEPTKPFREAGVKLRADARISWIDDRLPNLATLDASARQDVIILDAVFMHLDLNERTRSMARLADLLRPGGALFMSLRHGPVPHGRRMFEVTAEETVELAAQYRLAPIYERRNAPSFQSQNTQACVRWTVLLFEKSGA